MKPTDGTATLNLDGQCIDIGFDLRFDNTGKIIGYEIKSHNEIDTLQASEVSQLIATHHDEIDSAINAIIARMPS